MIRRLLNWVRSRFAKRPAEPLPCTHHREYHLMVNPNGPGVCEDLSRPYPCEACARIAKGYCPCHGVTPEQCYEGYLNGPGF